MNRKISSWGVTIVPPQTKKLFCGTYGLGAMAEIDDIMEKINLY
jgi:phosphopantothenoylcysteine synthetase/decarboxylase